MREEVKAIRWLMLGALSAGLPLCNGMIHDDDFEDAEAEREVLRSMFVGSFLAAVCSLPVNFSDEERRFIVDAVEKDTLIEVIWKLSGPWYVLIRMESPPLLTHQTRREVFGIHADLMAKSDNPLRGQILSAINNSTRLALRLFSSYLIDFECPDEW